MIKGILFDFNGTMFFDGPMHKKAWNTFSLKYRNKPITDDELDHMHGQTNKRIIEMLMGDYLSEEESKNLSLSKEALYREVCRNDPATFHLVDGLEEVLDTLKQRHIPMTICSASIKDNIDFFISSFHLDRWFDVDKIVYDDGLHTNKITMFQDGASRIDVPIEECLVFEDSLSGIDFAYRCHVAKIIAITTLDKVAEYKQLPGVNTVIQDFMKFDYSLLK